MIGRFRDDEAVALQEAVAANSSTMMVLVALTAYSVIALPSIYQHKQCP